jgi:hypothetical protein
MKTAVEWFVEEMFKQGYFNDTPLTVKNIEHFVKQAKEMEKEQRKKDFVNGYKARAKESNLIFDEISEKYAIYLFNETFKSE